MTPCATCAARSTHSTVRDNGMGGVDTTLGLDALGDELWACRDCGQRYRRSFELSEPPHWFSDYDLYFFNKVEPLLVAPAISRPTPALPPVAQARPAATLVFRCPKCRSLEVGCNEQKSAYEFSYLECAACGHGELVDWMDRDAWVITVQDREDSVAGLVTPPAAPVISQSSESQSPPLQGLELGCVMCTGDDAELAWDSMETHHLRSLVQEAHFRIELKRCFCEQYFAVVFTERTVFTVGTADQTWLAVPITDAERARLEAHDPSARPGILGACARHRRFLRRSRDAPAASWCEAGFAIFPHD